MSSFTEGMESAQATSQARNPFNVILSRFQEAQARRYAEDQQRKKEEAELQKSLQSMNYQFIYDKELAKATEEEKRKTEFGEQLLSGKLSEIPEEQPTTEGEISFKGTPLEAIAGGKRYKATQKTSSAAGVTTNEEIQGAAQGIVSGNIPPDISKNTSFRDRTRVVAALEKSGFSLSDANTEWNATQKFVSSMNSEKQIRLRQAITSVNDALGGLSQLNEEFKRTNFAPLNKAQIVFAANSGNPLAVKYIGQINIIRDELAQVFMGGNSPTDKALNLAKDTLNKDWSSEQLSAAIDNIKINLKYRENAINAATTQGTKQGAGTRYLPIEKTPFSAVNPQQTSEQKTNDPEYQKYLQAIGQ